MQWPRRAEWPDHLRLLQLIQALPPRVETRPRIGEGKRERVGSMPPRIWLGWIASQLLSAPAGSAREHHCVYVALAWPFSAREHRCLGLVAGSVASTNCDGRAMFCRQAVPSATEVHIMAVCFSWVRGGRDSAEEETVSRGRDSAVEETEDPGEEGKGL